MYELIQNDRTAVNPCAKDGTLDYNGSEYGLMGILRARNAESISNYIKELHQEFENL